MAQSSRPSRRPAPAEPEPTRFQKFLVSGFGLVVGFALFGLIVVLVNLLPLGHSTPQHAASLVVAGAVVLGGSGYLAYKDRSVLPFTIAAWIGGVLMLLTWVIR